MPSTTRTGSRCVFSWLRTQTTNASGGRKARARRMPRAVQSTRGQREAALGPAARGARRGKPPWRRPRHPEGPPLASAPVEWLVLDTSLLLGGKDPPRGARWATTPEAAAEVSPGGRDARRFEDWSSVGLEVRS